MWYISKDTVGLVVNNSQREFSDNFFYGLWGPSFAHHKQMVSAGLKWDPGAQPSCHRHQRELLPSL